MVNVNYVTKNYVKKSSAISRNNYGRRTND